MSNPESIERACRFCPEKPPHEERTCLDRMRKLATDGHGSHEWGWYEDDVPYLLDLIAQFQEAEDIDYEQNWAYPGALADIERRRQETESDPKP